MEKELINKLHKAGVDADTILALILDEEAAQDQTPSGDTGAESSADSQAGNITPNAQETQAQGNQDAILAAINKLTGAIQANNILNAGGDKPAVITVDDVMKKLIMPDKPGGKE